jgi:flagellar hook assembly protein FlgD
MVVVDISVPSNPQEVGHYKTPGWAHGVAADGDYVYVADGSAGLQIYKNLLEGVEESKEEMPAGVLLYQNEPNPFVEVTNIKFQIPNKSRVRLKVYDLSGRLVKILVDNEMERGYYEVKWDGRNSFGEKVGEGIYFYELQAGKLKTVKKTILLR